MSCIQYSMKNVKFFRSIVCNFLLIFSIFAVFMFTLVSPLQSVYRADQLSPIYIGNTSTNKVCMMINVYWGTEYLEDMLKILKDNNIRTTFFIGGTWASKENSVLKKIASDGHEIANHGYYHKEHEHLSYERNKEEIEICHKLVSSLIGVEMNLFAPPGGSFSQTTLKVAQSLGYKTIMWSRDTIDWRDKDANLIFSRATKDLKGGELILMHPTKCTLEALPRIIQYITSHSLSATTVSDCITGI